MRVVEIVRVDGRGRITMPASLRDSFGIAEGMQVMLIGDVDKHQIRIIPFADPEAQLMEIQITLTDESGALAKIANILAENNVDLLTSQSRTLRRGKSAEWFVVADISKCELEMKELMDKITASKFAEKVQYKKFE